jgi:hypothetical protein
VLHALARPCSNIHVELAPEALLDHDAAHLAIEVAEDVVEIGAPRVAGDSSRFSLTVRRGEDGSATAVARSTRGSLWVV